MSPPSDPRPLPFPLLQVATDRISDSELLFYSGIIQNRAHHCVTGIGFFIWTVCISIFTLLLSSSPSQKHAKVCSLSSCYWAPASVLVWDEATVNTLCIPVWAYGFAVLRKLLAGMVRFAGIFLFKKFLEYLPCILSQDGKAHGMREIPFSLS